MARPRKFVRINGREIFGLSYNNKGGYYYTLVEKGGKTVRQYLGTDLAKAVESIQSAGMVNNPSVPWTWTPAYQQEQEAKGVQTVQGLLLDDGLPSAPILQPTAERLSNCLSSWLELRLEDKGVKTTYDKDVERTFKRFIALVGDLPISHITADHFPQWRRWVKKEAKQRTSAKWAKDQHKYLSGVLRACKEDRPSWRFPDGLLEWATLPKRESKKLKYTPDKHNRRAFPADLFKTIIQHCRTLAGSNTDGMSKATQSDKGKIRRAKSRIKRGVQLEAMFRVAVNCGFDNVDFCGNTEREGLQWKDLHLDADVPYMDLPRVKTGCERMTPLLPDTVAALKAWRKLTTKGGYVFRTDRGTKHSSDTIFEQLRDMIKESGVANGWTFKHFRNVGSNVGKKAKLSLFEVEAFLGHTINGTSRFYLDDDVDQTYLLPLVNCIGTEYFDGEQMQLE